MKVGLIIVGDEILSGKREDKHLPRVIELLTKRGMALSWVRYCGDEPEQLTADLAYARASGDLVFSCGGIGATPDDHTRQCAAKAWDLPLAMHPQAHDLIMERMRAMAAEKGEVFDATRDHSHRLNMGVFPQGAAIVPNPFNQIPGFSLSGNKGQGAVYFVPGFPVMAWPMIEWVLDTHCAHLHSSQVQHECSVIVMGAMEASLTPLMLEVEATFPGVKVFSLPSVDHPQWGKHIDLGVKGANATQVRAAYGVMREGLLSRQAQLGPEAVR
ncbi:MAG: competence/damage-inducible protein A [Rhizobacter sp.]